MSFFLDNFLTPGLILNRFSEAPFGCEYASVDVSYLKIGCEITSSRGNTHTHRHTDTQTDRHTDIHKGNNNEIKYAKDITAIKNNSL